MNNLESRIESLESKLNKEELKATNVFYSNQDDGEICRVVMGASLERASRQYDRLDGETEKTFLERVEKTDNENQ